MYVAHKTSQTRLAAAISAISQSFISLVGLVVQLVKNLSADVLDLRNISVKVILGDVNLWHLTNITIQQLDGSHDVVQHPTAKKGG